MTEQEQLLEAVFAAPKDDAPRLVYADWLEEHGDPEHAALIRFQCNADPVLASTSRWGAWRERKKQVWGACVRAWGKAFPGVKLKMDLFERGMPEGPLTLTVEEFMRFSDSMWPRLPLRRIRLKRGEDCTPALAQCEYLKRLTALEISAVQQSWTWAIIAHQAVQALFASDLGGNMRTIHIGQVLFTRGLLQAIQDSPLLGTLDELRVVGSLLHTDGVGRGPCTLFASRSNGDMRQKVQEFIDRCETYYPSVFSTSFYPD